jgi:poly(3-hydroxybutyrate) depolymerase
VRQGTSSRTRSTLLAAASAVILLLVGLAGTHLAAASTGAATPAASTAGCGKTPVLTNGTHTVQSSGANRTYILSIPSNYDKNHAYRLIFGLHWLNGTANDVATGDADGAAWAFYGQKQLSNNSTIFVAPQGIDNGWANTGGRDLTLVDDLTQLVEGGLCVDTTQLFALGWSYGGAMSYAIACARPTVFRAVAVFSGANLSGCNGGTQPVGYLGIHGIHDSVLNISNGRSLRDTFVRNNGCTAQNPPEPAQGSLTHIVTSYAGCRSGYPVQWAAFDGDHTPDPVDGSTATSGTRTWTSALVYQFFAQFPSTGTSPTPSPTSASPSPSRTSASPSPSTTSASPSPTPSGSSPGTAVCRVTDTVNAWNTGLTSSITITNTGATAISGWSLVFGLPGGQTITSGWNATYSPASGQVTAKNVGYNAGIAAGAAVTIGFQATHTGNSAAPSAFTLNGAPCSTA